MSKFSNQQYLLNEQYKNASNLNARIEIHRRFSTNQYGWFNWMFDTFTTLPRQANVLELGTGSGALWVDLAGKISPGWTITLSDLSPGMLDAAWRNLVVTGRNYKFEQIDAQSIPYADETFDIIIANHMLYHIPDRKKALAEIRRVLKKGGTLLAATNGKNHMPEMWDLVSQATKGKQKRIILQFDLENGKDQLQEFFSHVESSRYPDSLRVTDVGMIMAYIRSMGSVEELSTEEMKKIESELVEALAENGTITISKDTGLFKAIK